MPRITGYRKAHFNAAHRLYRENWSDEKNEDTFGKCNNPYFHGHNYEIIVGVTGEIDPVTGYVYDLGHLRDLIRTEIEDAFDHKNLNIEVPEFKELNPTAENICVLSWQKLRKHLPDSLDLEVTLYETPRNYVRYTGE